MMMVPFLLTSAVKSAVATDALGGRKGHVIKGKMIFLMPYLFY